MNLKLYFLLLFSLLTCQLSAQLMGRIIDENNEPLGHVTIFVPSTGQGTVTNNDGYYSLDVDQGRRVVIFQFLGYKTVEKKINMGASQELDVQMGVQALELEVVEIYDGKENPAYTIMRKAIAKASWHRKQIDHYTAKVYIKGAGRLKKAPLLLRRTIEKEGIDSTVAFTTESVSEIEYRRPNYLKEKVISYYQTGDDQGINANQYVNQSFYQEKITDIVSPLSPRAFAYYKFEIGGFFMDRGVGINKIKVIPRSRGENVFEGTIYIIEDLWAIHSVDLDTYMQGIKVNVQQNYAPIKENAWMPINVKLGVDGSIMGFSFEYNYMATLNDYVITLNPDLSEADFAVIDEKINKELAQQIEANAKDDTSVDSRLMNGGELTRKELRKLMKEYEKEERQQQEEPEVVSNRFYEVDSLAGTQDSTYWNTVRPVPLTTHEVRGYQRVDSLATVAKEKEEQEGMGNSLNKKSGNNFGLGDLLFGGNYKLNKRKDRLSFTPLLLGTNFNPVEGFNLSTKLTYKVNTPNKWYVDLTPRYAFSRKKLTGKARVRYIYKEDGKTNIWQLGGGRYIYQYDGASSLDEIVNTYLNLIEERNYIRLYEKDFVRLANQWSIKENWQLQTAVQWANYYQLQNITTQTWFPREGRSYASNQPQNIEVGDEFKPEQKSTEIAVTLTTRPWQKYRRYNGKRQNIEGSSPTITTMFRGGLEGVLEGETDFAHLEVGFKHNLTMRAGSLLRINAKAGTFLSANKLNFANYKHFQGNQVTVATFDAIESYRLLPYYEASTKDKYVNLHLQYQFRKLLLTQIPEVWLLGIKEEVIGNYLYTPTMESYYEVGYAITNILHLFRIEAAVSFQNGKYRDWGIFIGVQSDLFSIE